MFTVPKLLFFALCQKMTLKGDVTLERKFLYKGVVMDAHYFDKYACQND